QHLRAVDAYVECSGAGSGEESFREVQAHRLRGSTAKARNRISEVPNSRCLIHGGGGWVRHAAGVDGVGVIDGASAIEIFIGQEWTYCRATGINGNVSNCWTGRSRCLVRRTGGAGRIDAFHHIEISSGGGCCRVRKGSSKYTACDLIGAGRSESRRSAAENAVSHIAGSGARRPAQIHLAAG